MIDSVLDAIREQAGLDLRVEEELKRPRTARSARVFLCRAAGDRYLVTLSTDASEDFYLCRAVSYQREFDGSDQDFRLNLPVCSGRTNQTRFSYALYKYYAPIRHCDSEEPVHFLERFYLRCAEEVPVTDEIVEQVKKEFLSAWPEQFHHVIRMLGEFEEYFKALGALGTVRLAFEHGDFTTNNITRMNGGLYLMDFEFARRRQPIGFDIYDYWRSLNQEGRYKDRTGYHNLHPLKYRLINRINTIVDAGEDDVVAFDCLTSDLERQWTDLYEKGGTYNLSPVWCKRWLEHFGSGKRPHIITCWEGPQLRLLAPFCVERGTLSLIGTDPDLYDQFGVLCDDEKYFSHLVRYLVGCGLRVKIRYLDACSPLARCLMEQLLRHSASFLSSVIDTKPSANRLVEFNAKQCGDVKRCLRRAQREYGSDLVFEYDVPREPRYIKEFIQFHRDRWQGGPFAHLANFDKFVEDLYFGSDLVRLSRLYFVDSDTSVAYHLGYVDSGKTFWSSVPAYNVAYKEISPGKVLLYQLVQDALARGFERFDFGRGAEDYKYWFSNEDTLLLNVEFPRKKPGTSFFARAFRKCAKILAGSKR